MLYVVMVMNCESMKHEVEVGTMYYYYTYPIYYNVYNVHYLAMYFYYL